MWFTFQKQSPLPVCFSEGTYEGGRPALPVCPEEASSGGARRGAERAQRPAGLPLPKPFPLPQENQCKPHSCNKLLVHQQVYYMLRGWQEGWQGETYGSFRCRIHLDQDNVSNVVAHSKKISLLFRSSFTSPW